VVVLTMLATYAFDPKLIWDDPAPVARHGALPANATETAHAGRSA